jgi:probable F420-dependent oxidoreductase
MTTLDARGELRARLGPAGVWSFALQAQPAAKEREAVAQIEELGSPAVWIPESVESKEIFSHASLLLSTSSRLIVAAGIANIWARDATAMENGRRTLADAYPGRFVLGLGVSDATSVSLRGGVYRRPYDAMRAYLDAMESAVYEGPDPEVPAPTLVAALGPRMLALAAERSLGAHTYFVPVEHTAEARRLLGPAPVLAVEQTAVLDTNSSRAREIARRFASDYLELPNYANNLRRLGWSERDFDGGGSDRLIDAVVSWGAPDTIGARVREHLDAGADHVCVQVLGADPADVCLAQWRELAPVLLA